MGRVKDAMISYEDAINRIGYLKDMLENTVNQNNLSRSVYTSAKSKLDEIETYLLQNDALSVNQQLVEDIEYLLLSDFDKSKDIRLILSAIKNIYNTYISTIAKSKIDSRIHELESKYQGTITNLSNELEKTKKEILELEPQTKAVKEDLQNAGIKVVNLNKLITDKTFEEQTEILSKKFHQKHLQLKKEIKWFLHPAITLTLTLVFTYIGFFLYQFLNKDVIGEIKYENHLMLIGVCSPIIFLTIWLFYQVARLTKLSELYSYKSNLGFTLKEAINFVQQTEGESKERTLNTLDHLLIMLYETPVKDNKNVALKEIASLLKEVKELVESIKSTTESK